MHRFFVFAILLVLVLAPRAQAYYPGTTSSSPVLISTKTASNSASLQFTGLPTIYNTLYLNCTGLLIATNGSTLIAKVGEGGTPTWGSANYVVAGVYYGAISAASAFHTYTGSDITAGSLGADSNTFPITLRLNIDNVASSSINKNIQFQASLLGDQYYTITGTSTYNGDTNPITGLEILTNSGNITSGTCSLYGMS